MMHDAPVTWRRVVATLIVWISTHRGDLLVTTGLLGVCWVLGTIDSRLPVAVLSLLALALGSRL